MGSASGLRPLKGSVMIDFRTVLVVLRMTEMLMVLDVDSCNVLDGLVR